MNWSAATHGLTGVLMAYAATGVALLAGLLQERADRRRLLSSPAIALVVTLAAALAWLILRKLWATTGTLPQGMLPDVIGALFLLVCGYVTGLVLGGGGARFGHQRGALIEAGRVRRAQAGQVSLSGVPVPASDETKHFKLLGTTGTGKSTAIRELLAGALARGDRAVIADPDGGYLARFYDPARGDVILNPFDSRSRKWDLFGEIRAPYDYEQLARSLIPEGSASDRTWRQYAQTFVAAVLRQAHSAGITDLGELYRLLTAAPTEELRILLEGTPAQPFLESGNERMFGSIRSVTSSAVAALDFIQCQSGEPFSIRRWIRDAKASGQGGVLFLPYQADQIAALRGVISTWMRLAVVETMTLGEGDARLWFIVDELDALGQIDGLKDALARLRKFGGRCVLGFQSIAQVSSTYGQGEAQTIVENCGNTLILRCSASEQGGTARFASRLIGEREIVRVHESRSQRPGELAASMTRSEQQLTESAVLPSEIEQLPDLSGYLKLASVAAWQRVTIPYPGH